MAAEELLSVVIPVYNGAKFLADAIRSVQTAISAMRDHHYRRRFDRRLG